MNIERLEVLAAHLETIEATPVRKRRRKFDIGVWFVRHGSPRWQPENCGYAACAGGEATTIPEFRAAGLVRGAADSAWPGFPQYGHNFGLSAFQEFLGISFKLADHIFMPSSYGKSTRKITAGDVAARIRGLVHLQRYALLSSKAAA